VKSLVMRYVQARLLTLCLGCYLLMGSMVRVWDAVVGDVADAWGGGSVLVGRNGGGRVVADVWLAGLVCAGWLWQVESAVCACVDGMRKGQSNGGLALAWPVPVVEDGEGMASLNGWLVGDGSVECGMEVLVWYGMTRKEVMAWVSNGLTCVWRRFQPGW
jgi:hypothetical protein